MYETCDHKRSYWKSGGIDDWSGEDLPPVLVVEETFEDIDIGRFRCTQCGHVMYYTGRWRDFHEKGVPCPGAERAAQADASP